MRYIAALVLGVVAMADWRTSQIVATQKIIDTYQKRLGCLEKHEAAYCIDTYPVDPKSDTLAKTFAMSFPKAFYGDKLRRDIELLERQKLCFGRALDEAEARRCLGRF